MSLRACVLVAAFLLFALVAFGMVAASESPDVMEPPLGPWPTGDGDAVVVTP